ncbi:hypothetical protein D3C81_2336020 [compost metagenome]
MTCSMPWVTLFQSDLSRSTISSIGFSSTGGKPSMVLAKCGRFHLPWLAIKAVAWANCSGVACM